MKNSNFQVSSFLFPLVAKTLALGTLTASVMFAAKPAEAASLTYNWSFPGYPWTSGTLVADDVSGLVSSIAGTAGGAAITNLLAVNSLAGNDNLLPLSGGGIAFTTASQSLIFKKTDLSNVNGYPVEILVYENNQYRGKSEGFFTYSSVPAAVPEPLTILGSITAAGFGVAFKRKKNSTKE